MDPLTHAIVGLGLAALRQQGTIFDAVSLAALLGSVAPDFDIVLQVKGDLTYLKHHRGISHSLPGLILQGAAIALAMNMFVPAVSFGFFFLWSIIGAVSHVALDALTSYGVQLFWPVSRRKWAMNLITGWDPVLLLLFAFMLWHRPKIVFSPILLSGMVGIYLLLRHVLKRRIARRLRRCFAGAERVVVIPAMAGIAGWVFLVETSGEIIVGAVSSWHKHLTVRRKLAKMKWNSLLAKVAATPLGRFFQEFTPHFHILWEKREAKDVFTFLDLRYFFRQDFLHRATVILDEDKQIIESVFQPYHKNRRIYIEA